MTASPAELCVAAVAASPGIAIGRLRRLVARNGESAGPTTPVQERQRLEAAVALALRSLRTLAEGSDALGAEILEFQQALLEDPELLDPAWALIDEGRSALEAWTAAMAPLIAEYKDADDPVFQARADDLADLRDRVADGLSSALAAAGRTEDDARSILVGDSLGPSGFLAGDWRQGGGLALRFGGATSHVALLARAQKVPLLVGLACALDDLPDGAEAVLDAEGGRLLIHPTPATRSWAEARLAARAHEAEREQGGITRAAATAAGEAIRFYVNVDDPRWLVGQDPGPTDGIGVARTEFLFHRAGGLPDEETQYRAYVRLLEWAQGRPVTVRTLDAGGDKPIAGLTPEGETNPFLGVRGIRLSLVHPEQLRIQLRALARAAVRGTLKVVVPMVTLPREIDQVRALLAEVVADLAQAGVPHRSPPIGVMIEVPAAAIAIDAFDADFYSIGSNDLIQYVMAAARDCAGVAALYDPIHPAILDLIRRIVAHGKATGAEVTLCGDAAADPSCLPAFLDAGLRGFSVPLSALAHIKAALAGG